CVLALPFVAGCSLSYLTEHAGEQDHGGGAAWSRWDSSTNDTDLAAVWGSAPDDVWVVGYGVIVQFDGKVWSVAPPWSPVIPPSVERARNLLNGRPFFDPDAVDRVDRGLEITSPAVSNPAPRRSLPSRNPFALTSLLLSWAANSSRTRR